MKPPKRGFFVLFPFQGRCLEETVGFILSINDLSMLDPNYIRDNTEKVKKNTSERNVKPDIVDQWITADRERARLIQEVDTLRRQRNKLSEVKGRPDEATISKSRCVLKS